VDLARGRPRRARLRLRSRPSIRRRAAPRDRHPRRRRRDRARARGRRGDVRRDGSVRRENDLDPDALRNDRHAAPPRVDCRQARGSRRRGSCRRDCRRFGRSRDFGAARVLRRPYDRGSAGLPRSARVPAPAHDASAGRGPAAGPAELGHRAGRAGSRGRSRPRRRGAGSRRAPRRRRRAADRGVRAGRPSFAAVAVSGRVRARRRGRRRCAVGFCDRDGPGEGGLDRQRCRARASTSRGARAHVDARRPRARPRRAARPGARRRVRGWRHIHRTGWRRPPVVARGARRRGRARVRRGLASPAGPRESRSYDGSPAAGISSCRNRSRRTSS
jgi:hypothetical protein